MRQRHRGLAAVAVAAALALAAASCTGDDDGDSSGDGTETVDLAAATDAAFEVVGMTEAVTVTGAEPGTDLRLVNADDEVQEALFPPDGHRATEGTADDEGNLVFARVQPDEGYRVVAGEGRDLAASEAVTVGHVYDQPPQSLYDDQELHEGFNYIETRDGTTLAAMVRFPDNPLPGTPEGGPYPTVIEYSGYSPANPSSPQPSTQLATQYGFATVGVNIRGTGCSGGTFSFFEPPQVSDGYDVVEAVAAQDWVAHGEVGMIGLSYPGITQLFVASTRPPHLASIAPLSVIDDTYRSTLYPGGIRNAGFAEQWARNVGAGAEPLGQGWEQAVIDGGGEDGRRCEENQRLRSQNPDLNAVAESYPFLDRDLVDPLSPITFVDRIQVPVFFGQAWQDEQTGDHAVHLLERFDGSPDVHAHLVNGTHGEPLTPTIAQRWSEFLDFYVARRIPEIPPLIRVGAPPALQAVFGQGDLTLPPDRFTDAESYDAALADYQDEPDVRVWFENGAGTEDPGIPGPTFAENFESWPPPEVEATPWYLQPDGALAEDEPEDDEAAAEFTYDPAAGGTTSFPGDDFPFNDDPGFEWEPLEQGTALSFLSDPLEADVVMVGSASADLWLRSTADDTDLEVTLTEVRPDGQEIYVQSGWLRASHRALDDDASTELLPVQTHARPDAEPLPPDEFTEVRVEIFPFGHVFREGSQLRVTVDSPGGDRALWKFDSFDPGETATNTIAFSTEHPSRVVLPVVPGDHEVPAEVPACAALRGQPCRPYVEISNRPSG